MNWWRFFKYLGLTFAVVGFVVGVIVLNWHYLHLRSPEQRGTFGDMFGGVNALFAGLAFAALIITLWMQWDQIQSQEQDSNVQKQYIQNALEALSASAEAQNSSMLALQAQIQELAKQRRLSILPAFTIVRFRNTESGPWLKNIGNGTALNVRANILNLSDKKGRRITEIRFNPVSHLLKEQEEIFSIADSKPELNKSYQGDLPINIIRSVFISENATLTLLFEDIEGVTHRQNLTMEAGICKPSTVKQLSTSQQVI